jgi:hypothetical protein
VPDSAPTQPHTAGSHPARPGARRFDPEVPHPARVYNVWLGGKDGLAADRKAAAEVAACRPQVVAGARANRAFLARAVRYLAGERGIRQFLDVGPGLPAPDATHYVAQAIAPSPRSCTPTTTVATRVVYTLPTRMYDYYLGGCFLQAHT